MKKPVIGLTPQYDYERNRVWIGPNYFNAIRKAGGVPLLFPLMADKDELTVVANLCDGFLFTGGPDLDPFRFGEETIRQSGVVVPERDRMEEDLFDIVIESGKPILGICRGIQILNVFLGGTVYQDIQAQFPSDLSIAHSQQSGNSVLTHSILVKEGTLLADIVKKDMIRVNSFHHQAVKDVAPSLKVAGVAVDSLIEALYLPEHPFFLGVQWHPEHLYESNQEAYLIFKAFVDACM
ncbi:MAG: putative glutamine amidotransferase [Lachnoclostridium sp.]|jgi:putative glutamine amidotransferase